MEQQQGAWKDRYAAMPHFLANSNRGTGVRWDGQFDLLKADTLADGKIAARVRVTTEHYDRANDQVKAQGVDTGFWQANPVVLWGHDSGGWLGHSMPAIAQGANIQTVDLNGIGAIDSDAIFHGITKESAEIGKLVQAKVIRTVSIGAIPLTWEDKQITPEDFDSGRVYPSWSMERRIYLTCEMIEFSFCNIPMNPFATVQNSLSAQDKEFEARLREALHNGVISNEGPFMKDLIQRTGGQAIHIFGQTTGGGQSVIGQTNGAGQSVQGLLSQSEMLARSVGALERESREISAANLAELEAVHSDIKSASDRLSGLIERVTPNKENSQTGANPRSKTMQRAEGDTTPAAPATEPAATDNTDLLNQILTAVQSLDAKVQAVDTKVQQLLDNASADTTDTTGTPDPAAEPVTNGFSLKMSKSQVDELLRAQGYDIPDEVEEVVA